MSILLIHVNNAVLFPSFLRSITSTPLPHIHRGPVYKKSRNAPARFPIRRSRIMKASGMPSLRTSLFPAAAALVLIMPACAASAQLANPVHVASGLLSGVPGADPSVRVFMGIPYAAPPVGDLRWRAPQPVKKSEGVRRADHFGPRAMQLPAFRKCSDGLATFQKPHRQRHW